MTYAVFVTTSDGAERRYPLALPETTIGSDASATICLAGEKSLGPKHVLLAPRSESCWVSVAPGAPLWNDAGEPVEGAFLPWGARLTLGSCQLRLHREGAEESRPSDPETSQKRRNAEAPRPDTGGESRGTSGSQIHPGILMILVASLGLFALQSLKGSSAVGGALRSAPALFADGAVECGAGNPGHLGRRLEESARARRERSVFDRHDGVEAVHLFRESAACYKKNGEPAAAEEVAREGQELQRELEEEYELQLLRLRRDLDHGRNRVALGRTQRISEFLRHQPDDDYALAIRRLATKLSREVAPQ